MHGVTYSDAFTDLCQYCLAKDPRKRPKYDSPPQDIVEGVALLEHPFIKQHSQTDIALQWAKLNEWRGNVGAGGGSVTGGSSGGGSSGGSGGSNSNGGGGDGGALIVGGAAAAVSPKTSSPLAGTVVTSLAPASASAPAPAPAPLASLPTAAAAGAAGAAADVASTTRVPAPPAHIEVDRAGEGE